jgi:hypothetical protein
MPKVAQSDGRCHLCGGMILGRFGKSGVPTAQQEAEVLVGDGDLEAAFPQKHPDDTLDQIVKYEGKWVHSDCARDADANVSADEPIGGGFVDGTR